MRKFPMEQLYLRVMIHYQAAHLFGLQLSSG
jgi:hypothetical protein